MKSVVHNTDCLEAMRTAGPFDLCVTDPPYGVLNESWDDFTAQEFSAFTMRWLGTVRSFDCPLVTFSGERTRKLMTPLLEMLYDNVRQVIWDKGSGGVADAGFFYAYEAIYLCYPTTTWEVVEAKHNAVGEIIKRARLKKDISRSGVDIAVRGKKTGLCFRWEEGACLPTPEQADALKRLLNMNGELDAVLDTAYQERDRIKALANAETKKRAAKSQDVLRVPAVTNPTHPCEKPVPLMRTLMQSFGEGSKRVLDPFVGSGSSRIAAYDLGFDFEGYELDTDYYNAQEARFAAHIAQPKLFTPEPIQAEQGSLI